MIAELINEISSVTLSNKFNHKAGSFCMTEKVIFLDNYIIETSKID